MNADSKKKKGAPACGLWLRIGPDLEPDMLARDLKQIFFVINGSAYEKNMHCLEITCDEQDETERAKAASLLAMAKTNGVAAVLRGTAKAAHELEADGVLVTDIADIKEARDYFGADGLVGLTCGMENDSAAAAYDAGADFVSFGTKKGALPDAEILKFWTMLTDLPAVIEGPVTNDYAAYYVQQGAAFLDCGTYIWGHEKGVMQGTVNMLHAIDVAIDLALASETATTKQ